ncbi:MAG: tRNA 2-selenouridine(34) synthase MnmH, partial [Chitinophagaceae bacterium]
IKIGLDYFGPKMRKIVEDVESFVKRQESGLTTHDSRLILIYCWRGGMRSGAVSWLLDLYGFKVYTLSGGYKKFRNYVLETFSLPFQLKILGGYTGSGKTELLKTLQQKGETIIDLEGIANHKGSAFGNIGLPKQPRQEMFENLLGCQLRGVWSPAKLPTPATETQHLTTSIWFEDESQRIGQVNIPKHLWNTMRQSKVYFLDIPFEERLRYIVQEYGQLEEENLIDAIDRISQKLGHLNAKNAILALKEGKITISFGILLNYYDKFYFKSLHNREDINSLLQTIECKSVIPENVNKLLLHCRQQPQKI